MINVGDLRSKLKPYINDHDEIVISSKPLYTKKSLQQAGGQLVVQDVQTGISVISVPVTTFHTLFKGIFEDDIIEDKLTAIRNTSLGENDGQPLKHGYESFVDRLKEDGIEL